MSDADGLAYWISDGTPNTTSLTDLEDIAAAMTESAEYQAEYAGLDREATVTAMYQNLFNRAPDADGLTYWVSGEGSTVPVNKMIIALINGAQGDDVTIMDNKATVGLEFADAGLNDVTLAKTVMSGVTADPATVTAAEQVIQEHLPGTFSLTTGTDTIEGTANDDTITAIDSSLVSEGTLQATDTIDGGAGTDTLKLTAKQSFGGFTTGSMKNVENVEITKEFSGNYTFTANGVTDVTKYVIDSSAQSGNITLSNLSELAEVELTGPAGANALTVAYNPASTVATGSQTDTQMLKVTDAGTQNTSTTSATNAQYLSVNIANVEALDITTAGTANSLNLSGVTGAQNIKISGDGVTDIQAVSAAMRTFDASGANGNVVANLTGAGSNAVTSVKSGAGDDSIIADQTDLTANATVDMGAGSDTLTLVGGARTAQFTMTNTETLSLGNNAATAITGPLTFSGSNVTGLNTVNVNFTGANAINLVNMEAADITVNANGAMGSALTVDSAGKVVYNTNAANTVVAAGTGASAITGAATFGGATEFTMNVGKQTNVNTGAIAANAATTATINVDTFVAGGTEQTRFNTGLTVNNATSVTVDAKGQLGDGTGAGTDLAAISSTKATSMTIKAGQGSDTAATDQLNINAGLAANAQALTTLDITAGHNFTLLGSFVELQNLTVDTSAAFTANAQAYGDMANLTLSGSTANSSATFGALGTAGTTTHNVDVTASGLKAGLTLGVISTAASSTVDISAVTGNVALGAITANSGITLNAANLGGNITGAANNLTTTTGNIVYDISNTTGTTTIGNLATSGGTTGGDVTVKAGSTIGAITIGSLTGNDVSFDVSGALNGFTGAAANTIAITANKDVVVKADNLNGITANITADNNSSALTVDVTGQSQNDAINVTGGTAQNSITVKGNLGSSAADTVSVTLVDNTTNLNGSTAAQTVDLSGLTGSVPSGTNVTTTILGVGAATDEADSAITVKGSSMDDVITANYGAAVNLTKAITITDTTNTDSDNINVSGLFQALSLSGIESLTTTTATSINASAISGQTMNLAVAANTLTLTGTSANDTIDMQNFTITATAATNMVVNGGAGNDSIIGSATAETIIGGAGKDTLTGGAGNDVFRLSAATDSTIANGVDVITDFVGGGDAIGTGTAAANYINDEATDYTTGNTLVQAAAAAANDNAGAVDAVSFTYSGNIYLIEDAVNDGSFVDGQDFIVDITGYTGTIVAGDIIA